VGQALSRNRGQRNALLALKGEQRDLVHELLAGNWEFVRTTGSGHLVLRYLPNGKTLIAATTPSDRRGTRNLRSNARRIEAT
jgi:hypothetical protein